MAVDPEKVYDGEPCRHCGGTQRWKSSKMCVPCDRDRKRAEYRANPGPARARQAKRRRDPKVREQILADNRTYQRKRRERGLCTRCGAPRLSDYYCWDCLNRRQFERTARAAKEVSDGNTI